MNKEDIRILLAEDEVITAMFIKMELRKSGFKHIQNTGTGEKAVEIALLDQPHVILMDVNLAGKINGIEAAKDILKTYSPYIIFMTGYHDEVILKDMRNIQDSKYLSKPVDHRIMIDFIKEYVLDKDEFKN